MPNQAALKSARARVTTLQAELASPETTRLGSAAVACVQRSLDDAEYQLAVLEQEAAARAVVLREALTHEGYRSIPAPSGLGWVVQPWARGARVISAKGGSELEALESAVLLVPAAADRASDSAETVAAAPTAEALAFAASMGSLRTVVACLGGALLGVA